MSVGSNNCDNGSQKLPTLQKLEFYSLGKANLDNSLKFCHSNLAFAVINL